MNYRLKTLAILQTGAVIGVLYALLSLVLIPFMIIFMLIGATQEGPEDFASGAVGMIFFMIFMPVIYGILGFIGGVIVAFLYNIVAKITGGIEFTLAPTQTEAPPTDELA